MTKHFYKTITLLFIFIWLSSSTAQNFRYDLVSSNAPYIPLEGAEKITLEDESWNDFEFTIEPEFGFTVPILGVPSDGLFNFLSADLLLGNGFDEDDDDALLPFVFPSNFQFQNRAQVEGNDPSSIVTLTDGDPGNQIFKMEYVNAGFEFERLATETLDMFTNQQIWVYEASGCIEFRYGPTSITDTAAIYLGDDGMTAGLFFGTSDQIFSDMYTYFIAVTGSPDNPDVNEFESGTSEDLNTLMGHPEEGVVYTFCPEESLSTSNLDNQLDWRIFPNPATISLTLEWNETTDVDFTIFSMEGSVIQTGRLTNGEKEVNLQDFPAGFYGVKIQTAEGFSVKRFVKQ